MIINFITPTLSRSTFTGGLYCILKHADELVKRGHTVNIIPLYGSKKPDWIKCSANFILNKAPACREKKRYKCILSNISRLTYKYKTDNLKHALQADYIHNAIPDSDITIATHWYTVEFVYKYGTGVKAYFIQHYEPIMFTDTDSYDYYKCKFSYSLPIVKITNSIWAKNTILKSLGNTDDNIDIRVSNNGIELSKFKKLNLQHDRSSDKHIKVISYSGRGVKWKGFKEMAEAIAAAREKLPDWEIEWLVYGQEPDEAYRGLTPYTDLGFLQTDELVTEYNKADILLSASWYESFPLFPIEAMACGLATITTQAGTEEYAIHGETAEIVEAKNPSAIENGLIKLITDRSYRMKIANGGYNKTKEFDWPLASKKMEETLFSIISNKTSPSHQ